MSLFKLVGSSASKYGFVRATAPNPGCSSGISFFSRSFYSAQFPQEPLYTTQEESILACALAHVPKLGFTDAALVQGCRDAGYIDSARMVFPRREYAIVEYHLNTSRQRMMEIEVSNLKTVDEKVAKLIIERILMNRPVIRQYTDALALMAKPSNLANSLQHLHKISDEVWWQAADRTSDFDWYTKRASVSAIYSAAELYMLSDSSPDFRDTQDFIKRKLEQRNEAKYAVDSVVEWASTNAIWSVNVVKSLWLRG
ncbi:ubiquinone biosynthesis protein COQ9 [Nadsonia fulvescens var. elongata DSM 6958]|uniref:Ubiquinone biosynthesis protein n=1 Tax=Nadsonia fulvescens var. elongata DSM 6958 TaxID=857566 RepID=A0A1E3PNJ1_9ASCO|nr:ubiquinone biosynthesis protein COQ9 [Nadsonia fulvescens var. elongata DSM 6958]